MKPITTIADLKTLPIWVVFGFEPRVGKKPKKMPYVAGTNQKAHVNDDADLRSYAEALADCTRTGRRPACRLTPAMNLTLIDKDDCVDHELIETFDSCAETSTNGGTHILVRGRPPEGFTHPPGIEVYPVAGNRFLLLTEDIIAGRGTIEDRTELLAELFPARPKTGTVSPGRPSPDADDATIIARVLRMPKGRQLFDAGDASGYPSGSEADLGLLNCFIAAGVTCPDRLDRLYRVSALYPDRELKWNRSDYRARTLSKALDGHVVPFEGWSREPASDSQSLGFTPGARADRVATLERLLSERDATIAARDATIAERDATILALTQTILSPHLSHTEKVAAVSIARHADAKRAGGQVEPDGRVVLSASEVADDWRPKPEPHGHIAPVNPDSGTAPHMPRSSARSVLDAAIDRELLDGEKRGTVRRRADGSTYRDWEYIVSPAASFAAMLDPWARWRPEQPKTRKVRESRACPHCGEVHAITRIDYCGTKDDPGCGGELSRQTIEPVPMEESFSPIRGVAQERYGRNTFFHAPPAEPLWLIDAPDPWDAPPQPALFVPPDPPRVSHHFDVGD